MEEIAGSFFDNYEEGFLEYLEVHKAQALKDREDYQTLNKKISEDILQNVEIKVYSEQKNKKEVKEWKEK